MLKPPVDTALTIAVTQGLITPSTGDSFTSGYELGLDGREQP